MLVASFALRLLAAAARSRSFGSSGLTGKQPPEPHDTRGSGVVSIVGTKWWVAESFSWDGARESPIKSKRVGDVIVAVTVRKQLIKDTPRPAGLGLVTAAKMAAKLHIAAIGTNSGPKVKIPKMAKIEPNIPAIIPGGEPR
jgi:hypothetical protein